VSEQTPHATAKRFLRFLLAAAIPLLMLAVTLTTPDPASDVKRLLLAWTSTVVGLSWVAVTWWFRLPFRKPQLFFYLLLGLLTLYSVAMIPSEFPWAGVLSVSRRVLLITLYLVASQVFLKEEQLRTFFLYACVGMLLASVYAFMQATGFDPIPWSDKESDVYKNLPATFGHPNFAAHALMFVIPFAIYLAVSGQRFAWLMVVAFLVYLMATGQRAGWIALTGALVLVTVAEVLGRRFSRPGLAVTVTLVGTAIAGAVGAVAAVGWTILRSGLAFPIDNSLLLRYQSYVSAGRMFFDRPLLGHGPGVYGIKNPIYWTRFEQEWFAQERLMNQRVHNDLIEFGIEAGLFSSGLYLALLLTGVVFGLLLAFRSVEIQQRRLGYLFAAVFTAFGIDGLFGFNSYVPVSAALFFLCMGMLDAQMGPVGAPRWTRPIQVALVLLLPVLCTLESFSFSAQQDMKAGMDAQAAGQYELSERYFDRGHGKAPWDWNFYRQLGHSKAARDDFDGAIAAYETLFEENPYYLLTRLPLAHAKMRKAQMFMRDHPDQVDEALAQMDQATEDLNRALEICPMLPEAHQLLGQIASVSAILVQRKGGDEAAAEAQAYWKTAEAHLEEAVKYKLEDIGEIYRMLSQVRVALNDLPGAEHALTDAVRRDPFDMKLWPPFLDFVLKFARFDQARNVLSAQIRELEAVEPRNDEEKVKRDTALTTARLFMANILENGYQDNAGALASYRQAATAQPARAEVWTNFARFAFQRGMVQELNAAVMQAVVDGGEKARETLPGSVLALDLYLRHGDGALLDASSVLVAAARSYKPGDSGLDAAGALGWAVDFLQDAAQRLPVADNCLAVFNIAICRNAFQQYERALGLMQVLDECIPQEHAAAYALHYADTLAALKQYNDALVVLEKAVNVYPQDLELRWAMARNLARVNQPERAKGIYDQLLEESGLDFQGRRMLEAERAQLP